MSVVLEVCDSCGSAGPTRYSPPHAARFCAECWKREVDDDHPGGYRAAVAALDYLMVGLSVLEADGPVGDADTDLAALTDPRRHGA